MPVKAVSMFLKLLTLEMELQDAIRPFVGSAGEIFDSIANFWKSIYRTDLISQFGDKAMKTFRRLDMRKEFVITKAAFESSLAVLGDPEELFSGEDNQTLYHEKASRAHRSGFNHSQSLPGHVISPYHPSHPLYKRFETPEADLAQSFSKDVDKTHISVRHDIYAMQHSWGATTPLRRRKVAKDNNSHLELNIETTGKVEVDSEPEEIGKPKEEEDRLPENPNLSDVF
jgi:hypothetical protein